ncbi:M23 family metallopeptidase [uncultured Aquimarina sp.]|uniref:M23 family metallopeptidase n=1 Tax=uncultured Aquimarina sp. TaxID=575652 RepID=UPI002616EC15|nr:M23 family metallopeptidase [uncultured Aquimarina sp.]
MKILWCIIIILLTFFSSKKQLVTNSAKESIGIQDAHAKYDALFSKHPELIAIDFDFPVGKPNGKVYYNAQKFKSNNHLGDDWNGVGGGNSDLGDSIYSIANGYVCFAEDIGGGWGNVIRIIHKYKDKYYESLYAHCKTITIKAGDFVKKGDLIGTIGNADGLYLAHLHLEIRDDIFMGIGGGYSENTKGYLDPTKFINEN